MFPFVLLFNFEVGTNLGSPDWRLVRDGPTSGEQEVFAKLLPTQLPLRMDRCPGGLRRLKFWIFTQVGNAATVTQILPVNGSRSKGGIMYENVKGL